VPEGRGGKKSLYPQSDGVESNRKKIHDPLQASADGMERKKMKTEKK